MPDDKKFERSDTVSFQRFLDSKQYSRAGILRYERIFGEDFISTGGRETTDKWLKPGGRLLITDYCKGDLTREFSEEFQNYVAERQYHLLTVTEYGRLLESIFPEVWADDRTETFLAALQKELHMFELHKASFIQMEFTVKERAKLASWYEVYGSVTEVQRKFRAETDDRHRIPGKHLILSCHERLMTTGSVLPKKRGPDPGLPARPRRTNSTEERVIEAYRRSLEKSLRREAIIPLIGSLPECARDFSQGRAGMAFGKEDLEWELRLTRVCLEV
ncbi:unnamed protein product [Cyprideis torosa]|uniref:phosphoethanolamine N-methyltransferase n=1 Tax=Cyprideis torosa TaxID=163714 RepID=A0A7R8WDC3_9CRUS|nr:unnamed protein product [Cyprideis torosa]CAG0888823.1 unnamed protein product [Cyprideis torosa]